jgi:superfamily I DNA/RNA helicase
VTEPTLEAAMTRALGVASEWASAGFGATTTCVVAPTRAIRDHAEKLFRGKEMSTHVVAANKKDTSDTSAVRFSTMHRAKGLEFDQVLVLAAEHASERRRVAAGHQRHRSGEVEEDASPGGGDGVVSQQAGNVSN